MRISLSEAEQEMLADSALSPHARLAYVVGIRPYVDVRTGIVGDKRRISAQSIREAIEYLPDAGSHDVPYRPSRHQVNRILRRLRQVGAIRPLPKTRRTDPMRVSLPLMEVRPEEERTRSAQGGARKANGSTVPAAEEGESKERTERSAHHRRLGERDSYESQASTRAGEHEQLIREAQQLHAMHAGMIDVPEERAVRTLASMISQYGINPVREGLLDLANSNEEIRDWYKAAKAFIRTAAASDGKPRRRGKPASVKQADEHEFNDDQTPEGFE